jgi:DNA-binding LacI/PurR family transcriptional regulator
VISIVVINQDKRLIHMFFAKTLPNVFIDPLKRVYYAQEPNRFGTYGTLMQGTEKLHGKVATLADVARAAGVSKTTASQALSGKGRVSAATEAAIRAKAQEMGFQANSLAQRLSGARVQDIVALLSSGPLTGTATAKTLSIQHLLNEHGLEAPLYVCGSLPGQEVAAQIETIRRLRQQRPTAIVCFTLYWHRAVFAELHEYSKGGGTVVCYDYPVELDCDQVIFNREANAYQAARHLLEMGHRDIGFTRPVHRHKQGYTTLSGTRYRGFERAMQEFGATIHPQWMFAGADNEEGGAKLAHDFLALSQRPTAMSIVNETVAVVFMNELKRAGIRVPQDLSIVSHDDMPIARYSSPRLTAVSQPVEEIGRQVVDFLLDRMRDGYNGPSRRAELHGQLISRESVRSPNHKQAPLTA